MGSFPSSALFVSRSLLPPTLWQTTCLSIRKALLPWTAPSVGGSSENLGVISNTRLTANRPPVCHVLDVMQSSPPKNNLGDTAKTILGSGFSAISVKRPSHIAMDSSSTRNRTLMKGTGICSEYFHLKIDLSGFDALTLIVDKNSRQFTT